MKVLVIGGTLFLGRHFVEALVAAGHEVTLFNRGRSNADLFPELETIGGDRITDFKKLDGRFFDVVVDPSGYYPGNIRAWSEYLQEKTDHYIFISSISAYEIYREKGADESFPTLAYPEDQADPETFDGETYGPLKGSCDKVVEELWGDRGTIIRPGLIVGPQDPTGRFTYWPKQYLGDAPFLAPDVKDQAVQVIDARDIADWVVRLCTSRAWGIFNAVAPYPPTTFAEMLAACAEALRSKAEPIWVNQQFLLDRKVQPWSGLPIWIPTRGEDLLMMWTSNERAVAAGLSFRPLKDTIVDTVDWVRSTPDYPMGATLPADQAQGLLQAWADQQST